MAKITYTDKTTANPSGLPAAQKFTSGDANEIKASVNALYDQVASDIPVTPYFSSSSALGRDTYRDNGATQGGKPIYEKVGGDPDDDRYDWIDLGGGVGKWQLLSLGNPKYEQTTAANTASPDLVPAWSLAGDGTLPLPVLTALSAADVQAELERQNGVDASLSLTKVDAYVNGTQHNAFITITGACNVDGRLIVNLATASGDRPALASASLISAIAGSAAGVAISGFELSGTLSSYTVQFWDIGTNSAASDGVACSFTVTGVLA